MVRSVAIIIHCIEHEQICSGIQQASGIACWQLLKDPSALPEVLTMAGRADPKTKLQLMLPSAKTIRISEAKEANA